MRRTMILGILGCATAAVLLPTALQANEPSHGGKKPKLPAACADAFSSAEDAFASFDEILGSRSTGDLGLLAGFVDSVFAGTPDEALGSAMEDATNAGQSSEADFFDSLKKCRKKVRT